MNDVGLAKMLMADHLVLADDLKRAEEQATHEQRPLFKVVVEQGLVTETAVLKHIARQANCPFLTSARLAEFTPSPELLTKVPAELAKRVGIVPVAFDAKENALTIATSSPFLADIPAHAAVDPTTKVRRVVALRSAIDAARRLIYDGDTLAFAGIDEKVQGDITTFLAASAWDLPDDEVTELTPPNATTPPASPPTEPAAIPVATPAVTLRAEFDDDVLTSLDTPALAATAIAATAPAVTAQAETAPTLTALAETALAVPALEALDVVEFLDVIMRVRQDLGGDFFFGHSTEVARLSTAVAERLGFDAARTRDVSMAAYLHDVGKHSAHITVLSIKGNEGHAEVARRQHLIPSNMFVRAHLPSRVRDALIHLYERFDGSGFPGGLAAGAIPEGARIVAAVDAFEDLTRNAENSTGDLHKSAEAIGILKKHAGTLFDPEVVRTIAEIVTLDETHKKLSATNPWILIIDKNLDDVSAHQLALTQAGLNVVVCVDTTSAARQVSERDFDLVVSEVACEPKDGFDFLIDLRRDTRTASIPFLFHSHITDAIFIRHAYVLGALDYFVKPVLAEVFAAKVHRFLEMGAQAGFGGIRGHGVAGTLSEIGVPDILQLLVQTRKTGQLAVKAGQNQGVILLDHGKVVEAVSNRYRGETAFNAIVDWGDGEFTFDPDVAVSGGSIKRSTVGLLLDALRIHDEGSRYGHGNAGVH